MTIHILDSNDLSVIGVVHNHNSFSLTLNYSKIGDFIISIDNRLDNAKMLFKDRLVMFNKEGFYTGIITQVAIDIDEDGEEIRTVKGKTLGHILSYRVVNSNGVNEFSFEQGNAETIMKQYVDKNIVSAYDSRRNIDNLIIGDDKQMGEDLKWQTKFETLSDVVQEISESQSLGWSVYIDFNFNVMVFDVYNGRDLSEEVVFSKEYENAESQSYTYDEYGGKNFAYVAGEIFDFRRERYDEEGNLIDDDGNIIEEDDIDTYEPQRRRIYQIGDTESTGLSRKEAFIEVRESEDEYIDIPELGRRELESLSNIESMEVRVMDGSMFEYGVDYNLGDIVSVYDKEWGIYKSFRISSVIIEESEEGKDLRLVFGNILPLFSDRIKKELKSFKPYTNK